MPSLPPQPVSLPTTTWIPPPGLTGLVSGRGVAVMLGTPIIVGDGPVRKILGDIAETASVAMSQRGAVLLHYVSTTRVIIGPSFDGTKNEELPAAIRYRSLMQTGAGGDHAECSKARASCT